MTVVDLRDATLGYGRERVLPDVDLRLEAGSSLAVVGTNGSGKSTLLRTLAGLLRPLGGHVEVLGGRPRSAPERLAYVGQGAPHGRSPLALRARDVVLMGRYAGRGLIGRLTADDHRIADEALARMDATPFADRPLRSLSGGQRRRVYLARALAREADLVLLDEPTAALDAPGVVRYLEAVDAERRRGAAVVVATHDLAEALRYDRVLLLAGRVVALGTPDEVMTEEALVETFGTVVHERGGRLLVLEREHGHDH